MTNTTTKKRNRAKQATPTTATANTAEIITAENVQTMGERIAIKALKTCLASAKGKTPEQAERERDNGKNPNASGNFNFLYSLYTGLIGDITERKKTGAPLSDGYDIAQTACAFLCEYIGKTLHDTTTDGQTDKDGNPVTVLRGCFRAVNRYIMSERTREYKRAYIDDTDENGKAVIYEIPDFWDIPTATDYKRIHEIIAKLDLPQRQAQVLRYRLQGIATGADSERKRDSVRTIAQKMGISFQAVHNLLNKIRAKCVAIGFTPDKYGIDANA